MLHYLLGAHIQTHNVLSHLQSLHWWEKHVTCLVPAI